MLDIPADLAAWNPADVSLWARDLADDPQVTDDDYLRGQRAASIALLGDDLAVQIHDHA